MQEFEQGEMSFWAKVLPLGFERPEKSLKQASQPESTESLSTLSDS